MATIRSYTSLEQSKKLAEILPLESADQTWARIAIAGANLDVPEELQYRHNGDMPFQYYSGIGTPCWSFAALLGVLPNKIVSHETAFEEEDAENISDTYYKHIELTEDGRYMCCYVGNGYKYKYVADNPVDACVAMIERLHELKML